MLPICYYKVPLWDNIDLKVEDVLGTGLKYVGEAKELQFKEISIYSIQIIFFSMS